MVKFLHSADWHLGLKATGLGDKAKEARAKRFETADRVVDIAKKESVDFIILAGDTFDDHNVDDVVVKRAVDVLNRFSPARVVVLPGTHDPLTAGGIWDRSQWRDRIGDHVHLLRDAREISLDDEVAFYPCPLKQKMSPLDPTEWIPRRGQEDGRIRIGVAHGALDILPQKPNFPIAPDRPERAGLDYLALGDWHSQLVKDRIAYPGTFEQTSFDEKDSGNILLVEIRETCAEPVIRPQKVGQLAWHTVSGDIHDISDIETMERTIKALASLKDLALAVDLRIPGTNPEISGRLSTLRKELVEDAFYLDWPEETITGSDTGVSHIPEGILSRVDAALSGILAAQIPDGPGRQFASRGKEEVEDARLLLHRMSREGFP